ncbi:hypothetical protein PENARI_c006G03380 [Penicillium arizonense]|uniref:Uncharacterized protein n=1 Tax=Penicillium arizonense TaxID=1835702 RepID=A0A1F5LMP6_PENAI|nr:hypothetical protein PENARI_c006G03380 [Penicillium arizonense]OGE54472.1 hypothetical protein PENARI_c006G03380 [Penicillium arizonense]
MRNAQAENDNYQRTSGLASPCAVLTEASDVEIQSIPKGAPERPTYPMLQGVGVWIEHLRHLGERDAAPP